MNFNKLIIKDNLILFENEYPLVLNLPNSLVLAVNNDTVSILLNDIMLIKYIELLRDRIINIISNISNVKEIKKLLDNILTELFCNPRKSSYFGDEILILNISINSINNTNNTNNTNNIKINNVINGNIYICGLWFLEKSWSPFFNGINIINTTKNPIYKNILIKKQYNDDSDYYDYSEYYKYINSCKN